MLLAVLRRVMWLVGVVCAVRGVLLPRVSVRARCRRWVVARRWTGKLSAELHLCWVQWVWCVASAVPAIVCGVGGARVGVVVGWLWDRVPSCTLGRWAVVCVRPGCRRCWWGDLVRVSGRAVLCCGDGVGLVGG